MEEATELEWLQFFFGAADFGPSHGDAMNWYMEQFEKKTGKRVPEDYREGYLTEHEKWSKEE